MRISDWSSDVCSSDLVHAIGDKVQCPEAIAAQSVLAAAALAVQSHVDVVHPATGDTRPVSLFLVTVAASGERKSAADSIATDPIRLREAELHEQYDRDRSEEHTSELQSLMRISYAVFCLKKNTRPHNHNTTATTTHPQTSPPAKTKKPNHEDNN